MPAFVDGDVRLFNSTIIVEYIEDRWPTPPLMPKDPYERAKARTLEEVMDTQYEGITWAMGEVGVFKRAEGRKAEEMQARARGQLDNMHAWLERRLGDGPWFNGASFGWGDMAVIPFVNGASGFHGPKAGDEAGSVAGARERTAERAEMRRRHRERADTDDRRRGAGETGPLQARISRSPAGVDDALGRAEIVMDGIKNNTIRFSHEFK